MWLALRHSRRVAISFYTSQNHCWAEWIYASLTNGTKEDLFLLQRDFWAKCPHELLRTKAVVAFRLWFEASGWPWSDKAKATQWSPSVSGMNLPKSLGSFLLNKRLCQTSHCIFKFQLVLFILLGVMSICFNLWSQVLFWSLDLFTPSPKSDPPCVFKLRTTKSWFQVFIYLFYFRL